MPEFDMRDYADVSEQPPILKSQPDQKALDVHERMNTAQRIRDAELDDALSELRPQEKVQALRNLATSLIQERKDTPNEENIRAAMYEILLEKGIVAKAVQERREALSRLD